MAVYRVRILEIANRDLDRIIGWVVEQLAHTLSVPPTEPTDVVVSACVLSQIIESLAPLIPADHPAFLDFLQALRRGHLRRMLQLLKPNGCGVCVNTGQSPACRFRRQAGLCCSPDAGRCL